MQEVLILDFGSQYTQLIARRIREQKVFCEIVPYSYPLAEARRKDLVGLVLSGGPASVLDENAYVCDTGYFELGVPVLGICYGLQLIGKVFGGDPKRAQTREYGPAVVRLTGSSQLWKGLPQESRVWMSHGDTLVRLPHGFENIGQTTQVTQAAIADPARRVYALQFHPEVFHTEQGKQIFANYLHDICSARADWTMESFIEETVARVRARVGTSNVICAVSGGVDSTVCAALLARAVGSNLKSIFVDNGLLRKHEPEAVMQSLGALGIDVRRASAGELFLERLRGVVDPEEKRKIIGRTFIEVFEQQAAALGDIGFLAQGTLYPDVIESVSFKGPSATIKSHHNVGGLPEQMKLELIEPLRELFKDEVRLLGAKLGVGSEILDRHPFPGPGLAVRVLGEVTPDRLAVLREADDLFITALRDFGQYDRVWQAFCVLLPVQAVGVMGDERTYENVVALRAVTSTDGMTADWARLPSELLEHVSTRIVNSIKGVNRVVYDVSSKPPATIEWE